MALYEIILDDGTTYTTQAADEADAIATAERMTDKEGMYVVEA